jgi:hypothetical protein
MDMHNMKVGNMHAHSASLDRRVRAPLKPVIKIQESITTNDVASEPRERGGFRCLKAAAV